MKNLSLETAVKTLTRNKIRVDEAKKRIPLPKVVGLKLWSCIDYLCKNHSFIWVRKEENI